MVAGTRGRKGYRAPTRDVSEFPLDEGKGGLPERVCSRTDGKGGAASAENAEN